MINISFTKGAIEYINQELNNQSELVLTISRKPKTSCFPLFTGNIIRLEKNEDFNIYIEKYAKVEENKYKHKFEIYIEKRLIFEEGNEYRSTIDVQTLEEEGKLYGNLFEEVILFNK
ncbi:MAG: hypothetical protein KAT57_05090 [Candidatus Lokiarchaeota archaeon]|nr:hypothetical protein [Candidatus Lokiarchaeota archaeon]